MRMSLKNESFMNFICVLLFVCSIYFISLAIALYHQYHFIKSQYIADQYDKKVGLLDLINLDLQLLNICQDVIANPASKGKNDQTLLTECLKYPADLQLDIQELPKNFDLNDDLSRKISTIVNRKNQLAFDSQSIMLTKQILEQLHNQLAIEKKPEKMPSYF